MIKLLALSASLIATVGLAQAQILNGGFEDNLAEGESGADNWSFVGTASAAPYSAYVDGAGGIGSGPGFRGLAFNAGDQASGNAAVQTFTTVPGVTYDLNFLYGNFGASELQILTATLVDVETILAQQSFTDATGDSNFATLFQPGALSFTAVSETTTLVFGDSGSGTVNSDMFVDNVSVTAVPEPASMAVLGLGLAALKRRRKNG